MNDSYFTAFEPKLHISASYEHPPVDDKSYEESMKFIVINIHIFSLELPV